MAPILDRELTVTDELDLNAANQVLEGLSAEDRIRWGAEQFGQGAVLLSSMQKTASVLMHMFYRLGLENEILFGDTGFHFHETLKMRDDWMRRYKLNIVTVYPELTPEQQEKSFGRKLHMFVDGQPQCCKMRKEEPFLKHMSVFNRRLAMVGARKSEGGKRGSLRAISRDPRFNGYALHPIFDWTSQQVAAYLAENDVPVHPLHAQNFPSVGCECCTTAIAPGEDPRAGRWRHLRQPGEDGPQYCGINFTDGSGI